MSRTLPGGHIYVIRFSDGVVKLGMTVNPSNRLQQHRTKAAGRGATVVEHYMSERHPEYIANELRLIAWGMAATGSTKRGEYFPGLSYIEAVEYARSLIDPLTAEPEPCTVEDCEECFASAGIPHWWPQERQDRERAILMRFLQTLSDSTRWAEPVGRIA